MIKKIKANLLYIVAFLTMATPVLVPVAAHAAINDVVGENACAGAQDLEFGGADTNCATGENESSLNSTIATIITIFSVLVGIIAVIMIIVGGFRYITSGGDTTKVSSAKTTILYALIGLVIVAISQIIVKFVLQKANDVG